MAKEIDGVDHILYRVQFDCPVHVEGIGEVTDDMGEEQFLLTTRDATLLMSKPPDINLAADIIIAMNWLLDQGKIPQTSYDDAVTALRSADRRACGAVSSGVSRSQKHGFPL